MFYSLLPQYRVSANVNLILDQQSSPWQTSKRKKKGNIYFAQASVSVCTMDAFVLKRSSRVIPKGDLKKKTQWSNTDTTANSLSQNLFLDKLARDQGKKAGLSTLSINK